MITGTIYTITCNVTGEVYVGSTAGEVKKRITKHKHASNTCVSKFIVSRGNFCVDIINVMLYTDRRELRKMEDIFIECCENCINKNSAVRDKKKDSERAKKYYADNKEVLLKKANDYYAKNKEKVKQRLAELVKCECGEYTTRGNLRNHKKKSTHMSAIQKISAI